MATIVVIEDNYQNARMANKLLTRAGYDVKLAEDGEMGLTTVFENDPDLILIDLGLPDIDGQTVIGLVRQQEAYDAVPIIAFTAWPPDQALEMAASYGCDGVITKPINVRTFADQIGDFISDKASLIASSVSSDATTQDDITTEATMETTSSTETVNISQAPSGSAATTTEDDSAATGNDETNAKAESETPDTTGQEADMSSVPEPEAQKDTVNMTAPETDVTAIETPSQSASVKTDTASSIDAE